MNKTRLAALLGLAGLGLTAMPHAAVAATLPPRQPGLWQSTSNVTGPDGNALPNGTDLVTVSCVDPSTDLKFFTSGQSQCSSLVISGSGAKYAIDSACTSMGKQEKIHETLVYSDPQNVILTAAYNGGSGLIEVTSVLKYLGACPAGMLPGDEGSMKNGAFSKTDNIDDPDNQ